MYIVHVHFSYLSKEMLNESIVFYDILLPTNTTTLYIK